MQKKFRLLENRDFKELISNKKFVTNATFTVYFRKNNLNHARFGLSVGKKHGNAVVRNKIKRQIRMMIAQVFDYQKSYDYVIMIRANYHQQSYAKNLNDLIKLSEKIKKEV
ncbi:ribonuclease P protein component [Erysipelotrichaceae bacterium OttesenSCG-928-M19]|nr:ribonuclease P protein component [Erysipelotrichaceae bacterium OttesenSCG-928-M19]